MLGFVETTVYDLIQFGKNNRGRCRIKVDSRPGGACSSLRNPTPLMGSSKNL